MTEETKMIIDSICRAAIVPLMSILVGFLIKYIQKFTQSAVDKNKVDSLDKYILMASDLIIDCVKATNQTFTNMLKESGCFNEDAQKEAFQMTKNAFLKSLSETEKEILSSAIVDFDAWINTKIESAVSENKMTTPIVSE